MVTFNTSLMHFYVLIQRASYELKRLHFLLSKMESVRKRNDEQSIMKYEYHALPHKHSLQNQCEVTESKNRLRSRGERCQKN